jgi:hypothetical protein
MSSFLPYPMHEMEMHHRQGELLREAELRRLVRLARHGRRSWPARLALATARALHATAHLLETIAPSLTRRPRPE